MSLRSTPQTRGHVVGPSLCRECDDDAQPCSTCEGTGVIKWARRSKIDGPSTVTKRCPYYGTA